MGNMAKLRNWHRDETGHLWGYIHDDPRWPDGTWIRTTTVQAQTRMGEALVARTRNTEHRIRANPRGWRGVVRQRWSRQPHLWPLQGP
jgi:hypothetical protein